MSEPIYDEDTVNLGYLKKAISDTEKSIDDTYKNVSRHYASKPVPPYYKGDTWIDGDIVYVCINTRTIGLYQEEDWVTESGAKAEAEKKNKTYLTQPSDYSAGDMWILQSDDDHEAGQRGEILISTAGRSEYNADDWVNMLGYGTIISINEVANNLNDAINRIGNVEDAIDDGLIVTFYQDTVPEGKHIGDLWYVTGELEGYSQGKIYRYDGTNWIVLDDPEIQEAFDEANEARIVADGKIQSFYSETEPTENIGVGDLWIDLDNNNQLYRYNGTKWVAVYDTRINELVVNVETVTERVATIETDLGGIDLKVQETTTTIETIQGKMNNIEQTTVSSVQVMYALGTSKTEAPTEGWSATAPEWAEDMFMWQKTVTTYGDGTVIESDATNISGANGQDGKDGANGKDGSDGKSAYQIAVEDGFEGSEEEWLASLEGKKGDTGIGVSALVSQYYLSTSNTTQEGGSWSEEQQEWADGKYFWTRSKITWTDGTVTYTDPILAEGINNANQNVSIVKESVAEQIIKVNSIEQTVSQTQTIVGNNYNELKTKFDDYAPKSDVVSLQTSVEKIQTDTYTKTEINTKLTDGSVTKVLTTAGTFDENGLSIEKTDAKTKGNFNEKGVAVIDTTSGSDEELLFAGYDEELGETIVRSKNMTVEKYFTMKDVSRQEKYTNPVLGGKGVGVFIL